MNLRVALAACLVGASGCGDATWVIVDAGPSTAAPDVAVDRGVSQDAPRLPDATAIDAGSRFDVPVARDLGFPQDVGAPRDVLAPLDAGSPRDGGSPVDVPAPVDVLVRVDVGGCAPEPVTLDAFGDPRNAAGQIRYCWPGEALCFCDRDNDCYAQAGYVSRCASADAGAPRDVPTPIDVPPRDTGTIPPSDPVAYSGSFPSGSGRYTTTIRVNGNAREVLVYVPSSRGASPPLMMFFHGTNGSGSVVFSETDAQSVANANGAILVAPSSRYRPTGDWDHRTEETYWETWPNVDPTANEDLLLTRAIIVEARRAYGVDAGRVYALGHSNGAFFATLVASALADRIAAFATSSGGLNRCANTWSCSFQGSGSTCATLRTRSGWCSCTGAEKPVALRADGRMPPGYFAHGTRDPLVSVQYTCELEARMQALGAVTQTVLRDGDGHVLPTDFVSAAWRFLGTRRR